MSILSIQFHVSHGYIGNKVASFALQCLKHKVININTAQFSNHNLYKEFLVDIFQVCHVKKVINGLSKTNIINNQINGFLTSHMGNELISLEALNFVKNIKNNIPDLIYLCNAKLGNKERGLYVKPELLDFYRNYALKLSDILVVNHFEAEILTMHNINNINHAKLVAKKLADMGLSRIIIISGLKINSKTISTLLFDSNNFYIQESPLINFEQKPAGLGNFLSALFVGNYLHTNNILKSFSNTIATINNILEINHKTKSKELEIIQGQEKISNPETNFVINKL